MPTAEQLRLRREQINEYIEAIRDRTITIDALPPNFKVAVCAGALAEGLITPADVPPQFAEEVALMLIKEAWVRERDEAADRGTEVHALAEALTNGEPVDVPDKLSGHVDAWMKWRYDYEMRFVLTEFTVFSRKHYYAGTGDFLGFSGKHPEWGLICGDYKTSKSGIWPDIALQLSALRYAEFIARPNGFEERDVLKHIKTCVGVQILTDGYQVVPVTANEATFRVFLSACTIARWKRDFEHFALNNSYPFVPLGDE